MEEHMCRNRVDVWAVFVLTGIHGVVCYAQSRPVDGRVADIDVGRGGQEGGSRPVHALFDLNSAETAPFPSDQFTVPDRDQITGRRVNMPEPDCSTWPSDCEDVAVINTLDGFSVTPRVSIPLDGAIDVSTVNSRTVFLIPLDGIFT
jgi:hypothetical protein